MSFKTIWQSSSRAKKGLLVSFILGLIILAPLILTPYWVLLIYFWPFIIFLILLPLLVGLIIERNKNTKIAGLLLGALLIILTVLFYWDPNIFLSHNG